MTLQEKGEVLYMHDKWRFAAAVPHHFRINESSVRTTVKKEKEIQEAMVTSRCENLVPFANTFSSHVENEAFTWMQDCYKKGILGLPWWFSGLGICLPVQGT